MMKEYLSDVSSMEDGEFSQMPEFKREQLLAEKHAEQLKIKQRRNLLEGSKVNKDDSLDDLDDDLDYLDDIIEETLEKSEDDILNDKTLFNDDVGTVTGITEIDKGESIKHVTASLANSAKVSKNRTLNILEHPNYNEYLSGALVNLYVSLENSKLSTLKSSKRSFDAKSLSDTFPKLLEQHLIFQIESVLKCEKYHVYGTKHVSCDHKSKNYLGQCEYLFCGRILNVNTEVFNSMILVGLNDFCNMPFYEEDVNFGDQDFARYLKQTANNLKSFTFTDEDVQMILEKKLLDRKSNNNMGKKSLIAEIQRYSHEIELLMEAARNDPSQINRLKEHERKKQELIDELNKYKGNNNSVTQYSLKTTSLLCASDDISPNGVVRKTTKPTPMIMGDVMKTEITQNESTENKITYKRTLNDLTIDKQKQFLNQYLQYVKNMNMEVNTPEPEDYFSNFKKVTLQQYSKLQL